MNESNFTHAQLPNSPKRQRSRWPLVFSILNFAAVLVVAGLLHYGSEDWWRTMPLVYFPKAPFAVPAGLLILLSMALRPRLLPLNLAALLIVLGPIMGFVIPLSQSDEPDWAPEQTDLRLVSCNIQGFQPDFPQVIDELAAHHPDIVAFQEVFGDDHPLLAKFFQGWHVVRNDSLWIGSKYPLKVIRKLESNAFDRIVGLMVEVDLPGGPICVTDLHFMTARRALREISPQGMLVGRDRTVIEDHQQLREQEMFSVREQVEGCRGQMPLIAMGDFNAPASSSLFSRHWSDFQNAFETAGWGFGYTSPCGPHAHWFNNVPWVRIDHILCSYDWQVVDCEVGTGNGSDHRLIAATLRLHPTAVNTLLDQQMWNHGSRDSQARND